MIRPRPRRLVLAATALALPVVLVGCASDDSEGAGSDTSPAAAEFDADHVPSVPAEAIDPQVSRTLRPASGQNAHDRFCRVRCTAC